jgi:hypothetical protein
MLPNRADWGPFLFVWGVWAFMVCALVVFVVSFGNRYVPSIPDDWEGIVPFLTGHQDLTLSWLWSRHAEHRVVFPRLILWSILEPTGGDLRVVMFFHIVALGMLAVGMILTAQKLRGRLSYTDAFFPLVLLTLAQAENLLSDFTVNMVATAVITGVLLCLIVLRNTPLTPSLVILAGVCLVLLPLCGGTGLALVPALGVWLGYAGVLSWRSSEPHGRLAGLLAMAFTAAAILLVLVYFVGFEETTPGVPPNAGLKASLRTSLEFLSCGTGEAPVRALWPYLSVGLAALGGISFLAVVHAWREEPQERFRTVGLFLFAGAMTSLALAIGWGRSGFGAGTGANSRYVTIAAPALCTMYFFWELRRGPGSYVVPMSLFLLLWATLWPNVDSALTFARDLSKRTGDLEKDLLAEMPKSELAYRHRNLYTLDLGSAEIVAEKLSWLREAEIGPFSRLQPDPEWREVSLPLEPVEVKRMKWDDGLARGVNAQSFLGFALKQPRFVYAIRVRCSYEGKPKYRFIQAEWLNSQLQEFSGEEPHDTQMIPPTNNEGIPTFWVNDTIDQFRIHPHNEPFEFHLREIILLVPPEQASPSGSPVPVYQLGTRIDFTKASSHAYLGSGWHEPEDWGRWSGSKSALRFWLKQVQPLRLRTMAQTFGEQKVIVGLNGHDLTTLQGLGEPKVIELDIPAEVVAEDNLLTFTLPDARSPKSVSDTDDPRILGLGIIWVELTPLPAEDR